MPSSNKTSIGENHHHYMSKQLILDIQKTIIQLVR